MQDREKFTQKAILVQIELFSLKTKNSSTNSAHEFRELALSSGATIFGEIIGKQDRPTAKLYLKKGKAEEIKQELIDTCAELVIFNHDLSPSQERNLEKFLGVRVLDRTGLILDIFASRASSHIGKLQVELAQLQHLSTRLVRGWSHLERQKGGIGLRGPGETQLETDRRLIGQRIKSIKKRLDKSHNQRLVNRYSRKKSKNNLVALIGYTNAGKTTLFNQLTGDTQYAADKPFATLDATTRKNTTPGIDSILFSDTVGFISDLPTQLIESFKATLDELRSADLLLHIVDISDPNLKFKIAQVDKLLKDLKADSIPQIRVNNKSDLVNVSEAKILTDNSEIWVSADKSTGIQDLKEAINNHLSEGIYKGWVSIDSSLGKLRARLFALGCVSEERVMGDRIHLSVNLGLKEMNDFIKVKGFELLSEDLVSEAG
ncbi:GTPase HflX [SAR86 cluster bacterium]|nr:GTPase HflX [SAR86 cluster bacterium]